ncbi:MAG: transposase [Gammaproteobacteria bacterium]|nr:transposase [Gammaproteobacteria bacterium]
MGNRKYTTEFKIDAVSLALSSESSQAQVARDLGINEASLYNWISQYRGDVLDNPNTLSPEQELAALKKENAQLKQEREILKKAAAYFARHQA